jgi:hypothetical protein
MPIRLPLLAFLFTTLLAANAAAEEETKPRAGDADKREAGGEAFGGSNASKDQAQKESERGTASRSYSSGGADPRKMPTSPRGSAIVGGPRGGGGGARF